MNQYKFDVINDKDFELLVRDLLEIDLKVKLQAFKSGRDGGIDLRFSSTENASLIVQAKHYVESSFSTLKSSLRNKELPKVIKLNPKRYIIATSMDLSPQQVDEIYEIFSDYMHSSHDIYFNQTLNHLISENPVIERRHFKLWLSSSNVLKILLNNSVSGRSKFLMSEIIREYKLYVYANSHGEAIKRLSRDKVIIITGPPGIGKTTLAKIILYQLASSGNFQVIEANDRIDEIEGSIDFFSNSKQIIFFDDFLGANLLELMSPLNGSNSIAKFINRIHKMPGKYLILTSRATILNQAKSIYESINRIDNQKAYNYLIEIGDYSRFEKARILYNHLYFKNISIEFITNEKIIGGEESSLVKQRIIELLDRPDEIWEEHYINNLNKSEKYILQSLFAHGGEASLSILEETYSERVKNTSYIFDAEVNSFSRSLNTLLGGFCNLSVDVDTGDKKINFSNPSVGDFLISYLSKETAISIELIKSVSSYRMLSSLGRKLKMNLLKRHTGLLLDWFISMENKIESDGKRVSYLSYCNLLSYFLPPTAFEKAILRTFSIHKLIKNIDNNFQSSVNAISKVSSIRRAYYDVISKFNEIIESLYHLAETENDLGKIRHLFELYKVNYRDWYHNRGGKELVGFQISQLISVLVSEKLVEDYDGYEYSVEETEFMGYDYDSDVRDVFVLETDLDAKADELLADKIDAYEIFLPEDEVDIELDIEFYDIKENIENEKNHDESSSNLRYDDYKDRIVDEPNSREISENDRIDDLFEK